jgi:hypothetical protein
MMMRNNASFFSKKFKKIFDQYPDGIRAYF